MKKIFTSALALSAICLATASCTKSSPNAGNPASASDVELMFGLGALDTRAGTKAGIKDGITPVSKDGNSEVEVSSALTQFYVAAKQTEDDSYINDFTQATFTKITDTSDPNVGKFRCTAPGPKYWPSIDKQWYFYASNHEFATNATNPTITLSGKSKEDQDIVCSYLKYVAEGSSEAGAEYKKVNTFTFSHIFARLCKVTINAPVAPNDGQAVSNLVLTFTPAFNGTYNLFTGAGKNDGTGWSGMTYADATTLVDVNAIDAGGHIITENDIYLIPGKYAVSGSYTLTQGDYSKDFTISTPEDKKIQILAGKRNNITATLAAEEVKEIIFDIEVEPWTDNEIDMGPIGE